MNEKTNQPKFESFFNRKKLILAKYKGATTLSIMTFSITTLSIMGLVTTLAINDTQHNSIECHYAECRDYLNADCRFAECL